MRNGLSRRWLALVLFAGTLICAFPGIAFARDELKNTDPQRYYVYINIGNQVVTVLEKDDNGDYTRIVRRMLCTTGGATTPTPTGTYKLTARERFGKFANFNAEYARYWTQIVRGIYMHSIMFGKREVTALKSGPYGKLGTRASHGCVRLYVEDAKWLYYHACPGTTVTIGAEYRISAAEKRGLRSSLPFSEYDRFQQNIYDEPELPNAQAWITAPSTQMRTGNGSNDRYLRSLQFGTQVEVLQEGEPWVKILLDGQEGYIRRAHISYTKGVTEAVPDGRVTKSTTNIYKEPDTSSPIVCRMPRDTGVRVLLDNLPGDWVKIGYWDVKGYIRSRDLRTGWALPYESEKPVTYMRIRALTE